MTRLIETFHHTCHVCSLVFDVTIYEHDDLKLEYRPPECARCAAPLRFRSTIDVGMAKTLLLTLYQVPEYRKMYGSAEQFLLKRAVTAADVDHYLTTVADIDYDNWAEFNEDLRARRKPSASEQAEDTALAEIRAAAANGTLLPLLTSIADQVKAHFEQEYAPYRANFAAHKNK